MDLARVNANGLTYGSFSETTNEAAFHVMRQIGVVWHLSFLSCPSAKTKITCMTDLDRRD